MARQVRDASLETRTARSRLKVRKGPYFRLIEPGLFLGYRKLTSGPGTWVVRRYNGSVRSRKPVHRRKSANRAGRNRARRRLRGRRRRAGPFLRTGAKARRQGQAGNGGSAESALTPSPMRWTPTLVSWRAMAGLRARSMTPSGAIEAFIRPSLAGQADPSSRRIAFAAGAMNWPALRRAFGPGRATRRSIVNPSRQMTRGARGGQRLTAHGRS